MSNKLVANKLIVLSAPSGTGKSTLANLLLKNHSDKIKLSISHTTRVPRGRERNGVEYFFTDRATFEKMISENEFLEHAQVFNTHYYGTSKSFVEKVLSTGLNVLFDIDVQGAFQLKSKYGDRCLSIFIHPPSMEILEERLRNRKTDKPEDIKKRLETAKVEIKESEKFDHHIVNKDLNVAFQELESLLKKAGCFG